MVLVAVVILNYNGRQFLEKFLPSVVLYSAGCTIYVADNASTDDSVKYIENHFPTVKIIRISSNEGFSKGYNTALKQVQAKYFILLNSDVEVTEDWVSPVIRLMENNPYIAACQPKILSYSERNKFEYAGAAGGFIDWLGYPFCRGRIFETVEEDNGQYDDERKIFWATGACMFVRSEDFFSEGGFDDYFFAHMEEIDLCWRFNNRGKEVYYCPASRVYHVGGGTLNKNNPRKTYLNFRNSLYTLYKNSTGKDFLLKFFLRSVLDCVAVINFLAKGSFGDVKAVVNSHIDFFSKLNYYRHVKQKFPFTNNKVEIYKGSIVFAYFVKGKKRFSDINIKNR